MKKKTLILAAALLLLISGSVFGTAIGVQGGLDFLGTPYASNLSVSLKLDSLPVMFGAGWNFQNEVAVGLSADWWLYNEKLIEVVDIYLGPGVFAGFSIGSKTSVWAGPRLAAGFQIFLVDPLEIFLEVDPYLTLLPNIRLGFQGTAGLRFWF